MKKPYHLYFITCIYLMVFTTEISAQANFFDVPSSDTIARNDFFFQEQAAISEDQINTGTVFTWGFGKGFEAGLTIHQLTFNLKNKSPLVETDYQKPEDDFDILINAQKIFRLQPWYKIGIGTRTGLSYAENPKNSQLSSFIFFNNQYSFGGENKLTFGTYYATEPFCGDGTNVGLMAGIQLELYRDKIEFVADCLTGTNAISFVNVGFQFMVLKDWQLGIGGAIPLPHTDNDPAIVIQFSHQ